MKISNKSSEKILDKGIYAIYNIESKKVYIGLATRKFITRYNTHRNELRRNKHFNKHLQDSWNIYGEDKFIFRVLFTCSSDYYYWEKRAIELTKALEKNYGYNMNKNINKPPTPNKKARLKQAESIKKRNIISREFLKQYNSGEINFEDIPIEYNGLTRTAIAAKKYMTGKKYEDTSCFKVPHTITEAYLEGRKRYSKKLRDAAPEIEVLTYNGKSLGIFRCSKDIEDLTAESPNIFTPYIKSRFAKPRKGKNVDFLSSQHINAAIQYNRLYKGLEFRKVIMPSKEEIS